MDAKHGDFIWNIHKERANIIKHGIDFLTATQAFSDQERQITVDATHSIKEDRYFCVGMARGWVMTVRFVYRSGKIRIFGAGYWRNGKDIYEKKENRS